MIGLDEKQLELLKENYRNGIEEMISNLTLDDFKNFAVETEDNYISLALRLDVCREDLKANAFESLRLEKKIKGRI